MTRNRGFSTVEIMVVLVILAVLLGLIIPNYIHYRSNQTMRSTVDTLVAEARLARQTARENGDGVVFTDTVVVNPPPNGATVVSIFRVKNGLLNGEVGETTISGEFKPGGKNLLTAAQVQAAGVPLGALIAFSGPTPPLQVMAFRQNGNPLLLAPATSGAVNLATKTLNIQMLVSAGGDVRPVQLPDTSVPPDQQLVLNAPQIPF